jgi:hypothetical protein
MSRGKLTPADRDRRIVEAWRDRPEKKRTADDVLVFYGWLSEHDPDLVPSGPGSLNHVRQLVTPHVRGS